MAKKKGMSKGLKITLIVIGVIFVLFFVLPAIFIASIDVDDFEKVPAPIENSETNSGLVAIGEIGRLYVEGDSVAPVCITKEYYEELIDRAVAKDETGWSELIRSSNCYLASTLDDYGRVLVTDTTFGLKRVRFKNPDALHFDEEVWTSMEFVVPLK